MCRPASVSPQKACGGKEEEPTADDESGAVMRSRRESLHAVCVCRIAAAHAEHGLTAHSTQVGNLGGTWYSYAGEVCVLSQVISKERVGSSGTNMLVTGAQRRNARYRVRVSLSFTHTEHPRSAKCMLSV